METPGIRIRLTKPAPITVATILLLILEAFSIFFNGAYFLGPMTLDVIGAWLLLAFLAWSNPRKIFIKRGWPMVTVALLSLFWLWSGISIFWSISGDLTWNGFNRTGGYLAVFALGLIAGMSNLARNIATWMFLAASVAAGLYSLGVKLFPSDIIDPSGLGRTSIPLGYTNALGLLMAMAFIIALYFAASPRSPFAARLFATLSALILLLSLFFTLSRGAFLALFAGIVIYFAFVPLRLRSLSILALIGMPALLICWWSNTQSGLMHPSASFAIKNQSAESLRLYMLLAVAFVIVTFIPVFLAESRCRISQQKKNVAGALVLVLLLALTLIYASFFVSSKSSLGGWLIQEWHAFSSSKPTETGADRLLEISSTVRWQLWQEAIRSWKEHPVIGLGAQTFPLIHLTQRHQGVAFAKQAHGAEFDILSELGLVGIVLAGSFLCLTLILATNNFRKIRKHWHGGLAGALLSMATIYLIHSSFDWDWNMVALTLPFFFFSGILVGWYPVNDLA
ncbi:MAG: O-antigen ligase family protein [Actinobacteria bacterium]|nr:O-antigen ligase family protein [Actinomycetota bacterium]